MGGYPRAWSTFLCNEGIYNLLLEKGADPDAQDTYGTKGADGNFFPFIVTFFFMSQHRTDTILH